MTGTASRPQRVVLDTNVVVAGLSWNGPPRRSLQAAVAGRLDLCSGAVLLDELAHTLADPRFDIRITRPGTGAEALVSRYAARVRLATPASVPRTVAADPDDDHVFAVAVAARAELIVTGDREHLSPIGVHQGTAIVTPREAVERLEVHGNA